MLQRITRFDRETGGGSVGMLYSDKQWRYLIPCRDIYTHDFTIKDNQLKEEPAQSKVLQRIVMIIMIIRIKRIRRI